MNTRVTEFLDAHATNGVLSPEMAAQLLESMGDEGDTGKTEPENGGKPDATQQGAAPNDGEQGKGEVAEPADLNESNAVVFAKDGKHTIKYEKLVEAREEAKTWKAQAEAAQAQLAELQAKAQERLDAGKAPTATDNAVAVATAAIDAGAVDPEIFGDFSEADLAKGIQKLVAMGVQEEAAKLRGELSSVVEPLRSQSAKTAAEMHYQSIYDKHPDADSIAESAELDAWINRQPSFSRDSFRAILKEGSAAQVIELFDSFKQANGLHAGATSKDLVKAQAKAAIAKVGSPVPASLSDIPGVAGPTNKVEAMEQMDPVSLLEAMENMTEAQRQAYLNRT